MNSEELKTEFGLEFPTEIDGYKRPAEPLESGHDWFLEIPQLIAKDKVLYTGMNLILSALLSNEKLLKQWHDTLQNVVNAQDWRVVTDSLKGYMTPELKKKLDGIATGANNYVHPSSHPATMITQDATHRFVTDTEKSTWNAKASTAVVSTTANGLMPKRNGNASYIFTGDGVWKSLAWNLITGKPSTFPPSTHNHDSSYLKRDNNNKNDLNSCTVEGIYRFSGTLSNAWTGTSWGTLLVLNNQYNGGSGISGTYLVQLAFPTDNTIRMRQRVNTSAWSSWVTLARTSDNITSATKATQDSRGQQIDTTYIKGVTGSNATLTVTKGNGTTSAVTINNVAHSTSADSATKATQDGNGSTISTTYLNRNRGGIPSGNFDSAYTEGLYTWSDTETNRPCDWGRLLTLNTNYNTTGNWIWQLAFPTRNGNLRLRSRTNNEAWLGWKTLAFTTDNVASATKATQDKNGRDITGYLYKSESISLSSSASIVSSGTISAILNAFCTKFKNIQGTNGYGDSPPTSLKSLNDNKAPKASPAFSGTPTSPTPATSDNSTKIATTAFVRNLINQFKNDGTLGGIVGSSLSQNGWAKFSNGLILQWGAGSNNTFNFPISFTKNCFCAILTRNSGTYEIALIIKSKSTSKITWEAWNSNGKTSAVSAECLVIGV